MQHTYAYSSTQPEPTNHEQKKNDEKSNNDDDQQYTRSYKKHWVAIATALACISIYQYKAYQQLLKDLEEEEREEAERELENLRKTTQEIFDDLLEEERREEEAMNDSWWYRLKKNVAYLLRSIHIWLHFVPLFTLAPFCYFFSSYSDYWEDLFYKIMLHTFRRCGPSFIKLGQWMATRQDLFPEKLCEKLTDLHSVGLVHRWEDSLAIIEADLGGPISDFFTEIDTQPFASGSIAQVYKARLHPSIAERHGLDPHASVVIKVRHPGAAESMVKDLNIIRHITKFIGRFDSFKWLQLEKNVSVFSRNMRAQLDMSAEGHNLQRFNLNFREIVNIHFPQPLLELTTTRVLVETFEEGVPITQFSSAVTDSTIAITDDKVVRVTRPFKNQLASLGIVLFLKMLVVDNFLHGDLHPGNIMVRFNEANACPELVVLDAGLVCALSPRDKQNFLDLFLAITKREGAQVAELMIRRSDRYADVDLLTLPKEEQEKLEGFRQGMKNLVHEIIDLPVGEIEVGMIMSNVLELGRLYRVPVEANFTTLVIGSIVIEGLGRQLNPTLRFVEEAKPMLLQVGNALRSQWIKNRFKDFVKPQH
eukprot:CAMPEP_0117424488 /NCGR_PEP_ID=MMETSP0758-20121206/4898_1 /TAXON_ID=63605 /ORGANISM="Percolomonas cosmopolitus, Strain AE-1 (ATCC 50343)" /LENGTH=590 /DNA_ID=CAMNT_0005208299 /DNA_START=116 /DNA_END=1888 /DNA_ORIENTATION=-